MPVAWSLLASAPPGCSASASAGRVCVRAALLLGVRAALLLGVRADGLCSPLGFVVAIGQ